MKKKLYQLTFFLLFVCIGACAGYEPIFTSTNIQFQIKKHSVGGEKKIAKQIYSKLYNLTKSNKNESSPQAFLSCSNCGLELRKTHNFCSEKKYMLTKHILHKNPLRLAPLLLTSRK